MAKQPTKKDLQEELEKTKAKLKEKTEDSEEEINQIRKNASGIGITTVLCALGLILVSTGFLYFLAFSQTATLIPITCLIIIGVFLGSILIVSAVNKDFTDLINIGLVIFAYSCILTFIIGFFSSSYYSLNGWLVYLVCFILTISALWLIVLGSYNKVENKCSSKKASCLCLVPLLMLLLGIVPLSKYHNLNQIEHDKKIVKMLQITSDPNDPNGVKILLPAKYVSENKYIRQVLCFRWPNQATEKAEKYNSWTFASSWNQVSLPCCRGKTKWYEAKLDFPMIAREDRRLIYDKKEKVILFFNHSYWDLIREIPLPDPTP